MIYNIQPGMIVRYSNKWSRPEERHLLFVVTQSFADVQRCHIRCLNSKLSLAPSEVVTFEMVEPTGFSVEMVEPTESSVSRKTACGQWIKSQ